MDRWPVPHRSTPPVLTHSIPAPATPNNLMRPAADVVEHELAKSGAGTSVLSCFERLPQDVVDRILSFLTHPRSRLPGLTTAQSGRDFPVEAKRAIKNKEDLTAAADTDRWAVDLFSLSIRRHPFLTLSSTSKRCKDFVEEYCGHLVRVYNRVMFNLPFALLDSKQYGSSCIYPDMSGIVYRRLWLQYAPRRCIYCHVVMDVYPFRQVKRLLPTCDDCFFRQTLNFQEIEEQYHIDRVSVFNSPRIRGSQTEHEVSIWVLRTDVETVALELYGTRAFHNAHVEQFNKPCSICAITRFPHASSSRAAIEAPAPSPEKKTSPNRKRPNKVVKSRSISGLAYRPRRR